MMKKKVACLSIALASIFTLGACGGNGDSGSGNSGDGARPAGKKIVIYAGGSSEFSWVKGSEEAKVIEYIEQKYYEDSGESLDFTIAYLGEDMRTKLASELAAESQVDIVISHTRGDGTGIDEYSIANKLYYDLADYIYDYAPNLYEMIEGDPIDSLTTSTDKVVGIPSVISPYKFGILVRKDFMEACGYTDDATKAQTEFKDGVNYQLVDNLETFEEMCLAINAMNNKPFAVSGAIWDIEKVLTLGAFTTAGRFSEGFFDLDGDGEAESVCYGCTSDGYEQTIATEYRWAKNGVISKEANKILVEEGEADFISGNTGVFVLDPTVQHLIEVARKTKAQDSDAEFTVLGALKAKKDSPADADKGFMRNPYATFAAVVMNTSTRVRDIMKFMNWVYKTEDNYNLCRYGIEGEHWINNGDGTYSYPAGKEGYLTKAPYSGILTLVENQNRSNLVYAGYTQEELHWINDIAADKSNYLENDVVDYLFTPSDSLAQLLSAAKGKVQKHISASYVGTENPLQLTAAGITLYQEYAQTYRREAASAITAYTNEYKIMKAKREARN